MAPSELVARPRRPVRLEACSRRELLLCTRTVVRDLAPSWTLGDTVAILITDTAIGRDDVRLAFDEINERYHVAGVELEFEDGEEKPLRVVFCASAEAAGRG
jgi:hypothetical protein